MINTSHRTKRSILPKQHDVYVKSSLFCTDTYDDERPKCRALQIVGAPLPISAVFSPGCREHRQVSRASFFRVGVRLGGNLLPVLSVGAVAFRQRLTVLRARLGLTNPLLLRHPLAPSRTNIVLHAPSIPREIISSMYYVYVLRCPKQFYIGSTKDLRRRFAEHQGNKVFATKNRGPWQLVYYEASQSEKDARQREKYLKTAWGKRYLKNRIKHSI